MERFKNRVGEEELVAVDLLLGLGNALQFPKEDTASAVRVFLSTRGECGSKDVRRKTLQTITAILPRSKWSCLLLRLVWQNALRLQNFLTSVEVKGFRG